MGTGTRTGTRTRTGTLTMDYELCTMDYALISHSLILNLAYLH